MKQLTILLAAGFLLLADTGQAQAADSFKLVVHSTNSVSSLTQDKTSRLFLKKTTRWDSGDKVLPVDQLKKSSLRETFSQAVHGKDVRSIESYWQTQIFAGRATPPPELASDAEVLDYVRSNAGAIGYVSQNATVGDGVKVVKISG